MNIPKFNPVEKSCLLKSIWKSSCTIYGSYDIQVQSASKTKIQTVSSLPKVTNDIPYEHGRTKVTLLVLLDLSTAFWDRSSRYSARWSVVSVYWFTSYLVMTALIKHTVWSKWRSVTFRCHPNQGATGEISWSLLCLKLHIVHQLAVRDDKEAPF